MPVRVSVRDEGFVHPNKIDKEARRDLLDQVPHPDYRDGNG